MLHELDRATFAVHRAFGRMLRAGRYADAHTDTVDLRVHKQRRLYAPLLIWLGGPLTRVLDTGVRVLPQREWENRERELYERLYGGAVHSAGHRGLQLPRLPGRTLAALLEDTTLDDAVCTRAIQLAAAALAELHRRGYTHGDAMAENVLVDSHARRATWFDFETVHDVKRDIEWCRADDVRALLATCLVRTHERDFAATIQLILDTYADDRITRRVAAAFGVRSPRARIYHLGQAPLSYHAYRTIRRLLHDRIGRHGPAS